MHATFPLFFLIVVVAAGCATRRSAEQAALRPGVRYTASLGNDLVVEIKQDEKSNSLDVYIMRQDKIVAQFAASAPLIFSQHALKAEHGSQTLTIYVKDGKLTTHTLVLEDDKAQVMTLDRDGDFFPDERWTVDKVGQKKTRESITHGFTPIEEKK